MNSKKEKRRDRKRKKLLAEYELARSNDEVKRPGQLLDSEEVKGKPVSVEGDGLIESEKSRIDKGKGELTFQQAVIKLVKEQAADRRQRILDFEDAKSRFEPHIQANISNGEIPSKKFKLEGITNDKGEASATPATEQRPLLNPEEFKLLKKQLNERKKILTQIPKFQLQAAGLTASLSIDNVARVPILMCDVQHLLMYALCGNGVINQPQRWCTVQKYSNLTHIVVLIIEGIALNDFFVSEHLFPKLTSDFPDRVEVLAPSHYGSEVAQELASVPLSVTQKDKLLRKFGSLEAAVSSKEVFKVFRSIFPIRLPEQVNEEKQETSLAVPLPLFKSNDLPTVPPGDMFSRVYLLLSLNQMLSDNFPLPIENQAANKYLGFKMTKSNYKEVSAFSPLFAIDCEMCMTDRNRSELTRIAVVNEQYEVVYESLVKPKYEITDYLTRWSGITKEMLRDVTTTLEEVQEAIQRILPEDAILVGHSLNSDLAAMQMIHPYVIDTSVIFNMTEYRGRKSKLSNLSQYFLKESIQQKRSGHCPTEDATAAMKLVKLKLSKGYNFGDYSLSPETNNFIPECQLTSSIFRHSKNANKTVAVVGTEATLETYKKYSTDSNNSSIFIPVPENKPKSTVAALKDAAVNHNFALAHVNLNKKLEKIQRSEQSTYKYEKLLSKVDKWCNQVYSHVSLNGLCVVLFSGRTKPVSLAEQKYQANENDDSNFSSSINAKSLHENGSQSGSSTGNSQLETEVKLDKNPRQNGVCFIRINSVKPKPK